MRVERFELITKLILSQPPLPIGLHAQRHCQLPIADCRFGLRSLVFSFRSWAFGVRSLVLLTQWKIGNRQLAIKICWCSRRDSNPHCTNFESVVSCQLDYASLDIADCQLLIFDCGSGARRGVVQLPESANQKSKLAIENLMVPAEGFEPTLSSF